MDDLYKRFGDLEVLKGVSLTAHEHDVIAILGASGSGKSTLLRCINLLEVPDSGEVHVGGELIRMRTDRRGRVTCRPTAGRWTASVPGSAWCFSSSTCGPI